MVRLRYGFNIWIHRIFVGRQSREVNRKLHLDRHCEADLLNTFVKLICLRRGNLMKGSEKF
jgi:hypothetical protein